MNKSGYMIAALIFIGIGIFLFIYSWPPGYADLREEQAKVVRVIPHPGTRYNVQVVTKSGNSLSCVENTLRNWPPDFINRCPVVEFGPLVGRQVEVRHDGKHFYELKVDGMPVLSYRAFRNFQILMDLLAVMMFAVGAFALRRAAFDD